MLERWARLYFAVMGGSRRAAPALILVCLLPALAATHAAAAPPHFVVKASKHHPRGYSSESVQRASVGADKTKNFYWKIKTRRAAKQRVSLDDASSPFPNPDGFKVKWFRGRHNISSQVKGANGFKFVVKRQEPQTFRARVTAREPNKDFCLGGQFRTPPAPTFPADLVVGKYFAINDPQTCA